MLDFRQSCAAERGCLGHLDGPVRDRMAHAARELRSAQRSVGPVGRPRAPAPPAHGDHARHGFEQEPNLRQAGRWLVQWAFRRHPLRTRRSRSPSGYHIAMGQKWRQINSGRVETGVCQLRDDRTDSPPATERSPTPPGDVLRSGVGQRS